MEPVKNGLLHILYAMFFVPFLTLCLFYAILNLVTGSLQGG